MRAFTFQQSTGADAAIAVAARSGAMFLGGGTTLVDLMKVDVLVPDTVVDVRHLAGMAAAIANAVYHATGTRVRSLPISRRCSVWRRT